MSGNTVNGEISRELLTDYIASSVRNIFSAMLSMDDVAGGVLLEKPATCFNCSVSGLVGLGGTCSGMVGMHIPAEFAREATASMLGMALGEVEDENDIHDAVGEIANMLAGDIKMLLSRGGADICLSTPTIISGNEYTIEVISGSDSVVVSFSRGARRFLASVQLESQ